MLIEWLRRTVFLNSVLNDFVKTFINPVSLKTSQLSTVVVLFLWNLTLFWFKIRNKVYHQKSGLVDVLTLRDGCGIILVVLPVLVYVIRLADTSQPGDPALLLFSDQSTNIIVFLVGILLSQIITNRMTQAKGERFLFNYISLVFLILFLAATSVMTHSNIPYVYKYYSQTRWSGLWGNPNIYGLLMGAGLVLACGMALLRMIWLPRLKIILCIITAGMMGIGLLHSYSRGAWLAAFCGFCYLGFQAAKMSDLGARMARWVRFNGLTIAVILCALVLSAFWQFRDSEYKMARRTFSAGNVKDFSWRNRVMAWEGALVMIADRPCFGFGWGMPEPIYENYYQTAKVEEGMAVQLNDYFTLGMTLGLPALACFLCYAGLSFSTNRQEQSTPYDWSRTTCRAGALVLLVGFWFDGGLFKMATSVPFWILLDLGSAESARPKALAPMQALSQKDSSCVVIP